MIDVVQMAVMASRIDSITREMTNTILRTARSSTLAAKDFSCSICTSDNELLSAPEGAPVHVFGSGLVAASMTAVQSDIRPGDAFLHNDPYLGNSHPADHNLLVPVYFDGEHVFTAIAKAHQIDIGNSLPTTYMPLALDLYEEGALVFPCVRVQRDYEDIDDIIRIAKARIRSAETWYGDFLASLAAVRVAERRLIGFCRQHGLARVREFCSAWLDYSERVATAAISRLPGGSVVGRTTMDSCPGLPEEGLKLKARITVQPADGKIEVDLRDNPDCAPNGLNLSEATAKNGAVAGVLTILNTFRRKDDPPILNNAGSHRRITVHLRENCIVGIPRHPHSCSVATSTVHDRLVAMVTAAFSGLSDSIASAEHCFGSGPFIGVVSGFDTKRDEPYILQLIQGTAGGAGNAACDGWLMLLLPGGSGVGYMASVEVDEMRYPFIIWEKKVRPDSEGPGLYRGAPGSVTSFGPLDGPMNVHFMLDGVANPPRGVNGGKDALGPLAIVTRIDGSTELHTDVSGVVVLAPGERITSLSAGGGGFGDPLQRNPAAVLEDVLEGYISRERATEEYGLSQSHQ